MPAVAGGGIATGRGYPPLRGHEAVQILAGTHWLDAEFAAPATGMGMVIFAHGSGSGRRSPRNVAVARTLESYGFGTLLLDLLDRGEAQLDERTAALRFDIGLLTDRLQAAQEWVRSTAGGPHRAIGVFGASTGAAAALCAAADQPGLTAAIVSRGGRSDLASHALALVRAPTLFIVGSEDGEVLRANERSMRQMHCVREIAVVPGAGHLFEEPGALDRVSELASAWFLQHLRAGPARSPPFRRAEVSRSTALISAA